MKLILATNNNNKIIEIRSKFRDITDIELVPLKMIENPPEVLEDGTSFKENAYKKASEISKSTKKPAMSDDSGLVVDALGGRPGLFSARYGGQNATDTYRNKMILKEMEGVKSDKRGARFICLIAIVLPNGNSYFAEGVCEGIIADSMKGDRGFGYDPIFYLPEYGKTMAEISLEEKNRISHRAKALDRAREILMRISNSHFAE